MLASRREMIFRALVACSVALVACSPHGAGDDIAGDAADESRDDDAQADAIDASAEAGPGDFGEPCTVGKDSTCAAGLICLQGPSGGTVGFCTKTCPSTSSGPCPDTPPGTAAFCVVTDVDVQGDKGCAFACHVGSLTYACPGVLQCEATDDPPGSGQRLCVP